MKRHTTPRIFDAQNSSDCQRLVAAQARMYSEAKRIFFGRILAVFALAVGVIATSTVWPDLRLIVGGGGGLLIFIGSFLAESLEKRRRLQAAATQELFDTRIYQISWNPLHANRPSAAAVAQAAERYAGDRQRDWYDDTKGTERPFDILICQSSNLGWGAAMHRIWAWILVLIMCALTGLLFAGWILLDATPSDTFLALLVPSLGPFKELISLIKTNFDNAEVKESTERTLSEIWERGMSDATQTPSEETVRSIQDKILVLRQTNSYIPDWLDSIFHSRNETAMGTSVADKVLQAEQAGRV